MNFYSLPNRAARCRRTADQGDAVILLITEDQRAEATRLVGQSPVIVATGPEVRQFLIHIGLETSKRKGKR